MATEVVMPQMGESIAEGTITKWLKNVGEHVDRDEPLFEISTDKVDAEIPSPAATEVKPLVKKGETAGTPKAAPAPERTGDGTNAAELRRTKSSPLVRKIASEHNIDIQQLEGTGMSGRVTKNDILSVIESDAQEDRGAHGYVAPHFRAREHRL